MLTITRETKKLIIISIFFLGVILLGVVAYYAFRPAPTCMDGIQNQNEEGLDCGGACTTMCVTPLVGEPLVVTEAAVIADANGVYDVVARLTNPNNTLGASSFEYVFSLQDNQGNEVARVGGMGWILPQETKTFLAFNLTATTIPMRVEVTVKNYTWEKLSGFRERPNVPISQKRYDETSSSAYFSSASGLLRNESPFDFRSIVIKVVLRDGSGKPLAANQTEMRTVAVNEERDFRLVWPVAFPGTVATVDMEVDADVYYSDNFIRQYLPGGRFQKIAPENRF